MADEQVESAATETETEVSLETPDASAETENTEGDKGPKTVPYARFQEVIKDKNETKKQLDELTESYQELAARLPEPKEEPAADAEIPEPPAGLTPMQRVQWLVDQGVERALKKKGLSLDDLATVATTAPEASREAMYAKWSRECAKHKIDPEDKRAQRLCQGFIAGEQNPDEGAATLSGLHRRGTEPRPRQSGRGDRRSTSENRQGAGSDQGRDRRGDIHDDDQGLSSEGQEGSHRGRQKGTPRPGIHNRGNPPTKACC
jgi:hypothetical protein